MSGEEPHRDALGMAAAMGVVLFALALSCFKVFNYDLFWHLRTGQWIVEHLSVPRTDMFSFTREGMEWIDAQWIFQVVLYAFHSVFGGRGATLLQAALLAATLLFLLFSTPGRAPLAAKALAGFIFLLSISPRVDCRPENLSCLYLAAMCFGLERARRGNSWWLAPVAVVQLLFVNSEGLWPLGLALAGAYAGDVFLEAWSRKAARAEARRLAAWGLALAAMALFSLIQPHGARAAAFPVLLLLEITEKGTAPKSIISEFQPMIANGRLLAIFWPFVVLCAAALVSVALCRRRSRVMLTLLGLATVFLALSARRNLSVASVVMAQVLMAHLAALAEFRPRLLPAERFVKWCAVLALTGAMFLSAWSLLVPVRQWDGSGRTEGLGIEMGKYPVETADYLKSISYRGNIINSENIGGYLIWSLWPQCKVFADPRMELGGEQAILFYLETYNDQDKLARVAERFKADAVAIAYRTPYTEFFKRMAADPRWALVHLDWNAAVFLRRGARWEAVIRRDLIAHPYEYEVQMPE
jgi:hypothetical protein